MQTSPRSRSYRTILASVMILTCLLAANSDAKRVHPRVHSVHRATCGKTDLAIFSAVLDAKFKDQPKTCILESETIGSRRWETRTIGDTPERRRGLQPIFADLNRRNGSSCVLLPIHASCKVRLVDRQEIDRIFEHGFWPASYKKFPGSAGLVKFSLPGYSRDRKAAIVYFSHSSGGLSGYGSMIFLKKTGNRWKIEWGQMMWIS